MDVLSIDNAFQTEPKLSLCRLQWVFICFHVQILKFAFSWKNSYKIMGCQIPGVLIDTDCITHTLIGPRDLILA